MKIAFFLNEFPAISETFILNQMVGLVRRGHELDIHAQGPAEPANNGQHANVERYRLLDRAHFYPMPESGRRAWPAPPDDCSGGDGGVPKPHWTA